MLLAIPKNTRRPNHSRFSRLRGEGGSRNTDKLVPGVCRPAPQVPAIHPLEIPARPKEIHRRGNVLGNGANGKESTADRKESGRDGDL